MKNFIPVLLCVMLFSSCHPDKEGIVYDFIDARNSYKTESVCQLLSDSFTYYYGTSVLNKEQYLSWLDSTQDNFRSLECKIAILRIQDLDSVINTEEQMLTIIDSCLDVTPPYTKKMTYRFVDNKLISIAVDTTNYEEYIKAFNEKWNPFAFYIKDKYGIEDWNEIVPKLKKYLSEYTALSNSEKKQYKTYAHLQGIYVSKDCSFYKKLIFRGKRTVTTYDAIFGFPFSTSYELDEDVIRIKKEDVTGGELLFEIKDSQTLIGIGLFNEGTFVKVN